MRLLLLLVLDRETIFRAVSGVCAMKTAEKFIVAFFLPRLPSLGSSFVVTALTFLASSAYFFLAVKTFVLGIFIWIRAFTHLNVVFDYTVSKFETVKLDDITVLLFCVLVYGV